MAAERCPAVSGGRIWFVKSGGPLNYTITLVSGERAFKDAAGNLLDGDRDGTAGGDLRTTFTVDAGDPVVLGIPDFVRGRGQPVHLPAGTTAAIPVTISGGSAVRNVELHVSFNPALLEITTATVGAGMPDGATVQLNYGIEPGLVIVTFSSPAALPAGDGTLVNLQAVVPAGGGNYGQQQVVDIEVEMVSDSDGRQLPALADDALHVASYFADVSGNGRINAADAAQVSRVAALIYTGFAATLLTDPAVVGTSAAMDGSTQRMPRLSHDLLH